MKTQSMFGTLRAAFILATLAALAVTGAQTARATHIETTGDLKRACETSPGNVVVLTHPTKISNGVRPPASENVTTGCTLQLDAFANVEFDQVGITFNGPFTLNGGAKANVISVESVLSAHSMALNLTSAESLLIVDESRFQATAGNLTIAFGTGGKAELKEALGSTLSASGEIRITGGNKFGLNLSEAILSAGSGIRLEAMGAEAVVKANKATFNTTAGSAQINLTGDKGLVEIGSSSITAGNGIAVILTGREGGMKLNSAPLNAGTGSVELRADGFKANVNVSGGSLRGGTTVTVHSAFGDQFGNIVVEKATLQGGGDVRVETGAAGATKATDNRLTSGTLVRIAAGVGGKCEALLNVITSPVQQICLP